MLSTGYLQGYKIPTGERLLDAMHSMLTITSDS